MGDETHELGPGPFAWLPKGVPHAFANPSDTLVHVINVSTPSGVETFLTDQFDYFAGLSGGPPEPEKMAAIAERHSGRLIGPPILQAP